MSRAGANCGVSKEDGRKASKRGYDFTSSSTVVKDVTEMRFNFGPKDSQSERVDQTLASLFDTLSVECSSILVHPQWKHFRHIRMLKNDRIRLSNGIWRSWHMQFLKMKRPLYCFFDINPELSHHQRQEAIVLEGKYWKRNSDAVAKEYRKWRFYKEKSDKKLNPALEKVRQKASEIFIELTSGQQSQDMQVDPPGHPFPSYEGFTEEKMLLSSDPYSEYGMMVQQPNLDMLNPMLDDILNKLSDSMPMDTISLTGRNSSQSSAFACDPLNSHSPITSYAHQHPLPAVPSSPFSPTPSHNQLQPQAMPLSPLHGATPNSVHPPGAMHITDPYFNFNFRQQQQEQQRQQSHSDHVGLMALMQGEELDQRGRAGGAEGMLDIQMAGNLALKCEVSYEDDLSSSQRGLQDSLYRTPQQYHQQQQQPQKRQGGDMHADILHGTSTSGGSSNNSSDVGDSMFSIQQQESNWFSTVMGPKDVIHMQQQPHSSHEHQHHQRRSLSSMPRPPAVSPVLSPGPVVTVGHSTPRIGHSAAMVAAGGGRGEKSLQFAPPSPVASPPPPMMLSEAKRRQRRPSPPDFVRAPSADNLYGQPSRPPLERGSSEPIGHLQSKLLNLNAECMKQTEELDKQKSIADIQYSEMLMQVILSQGKSKPSEQQQKVLHSILSDPNMVDLLKTALLTGQGPSARQQQQHQQARQQQQHRQESLSSPATPAPIPIAPKKDMGTPSVPVGLQQGLLSPEEISRDEAAQANMFSDSQLSKISEVSDFQKGLLMAAISQASSVPETISTPLASTPTAPDQFTPSFATGFSLEEIKSPPGQGSSNEELSPTQAMLKKFKNARHLSSSEKEMYKEIRRQSHISAEQKRRGNIKSGFDQLQSLVINPNAYPSGKVSKATILERTLEHIRQSHAERDQRDAEITALKARIEELNAAIVVCQETLPVSGAPVTRQRFEENRQRFKSYVQKRTLQNYKFWIFSIILQQLFESYNSMVSIGTVDELCRTVLAWFEQNCTLPSLRPIVMNSLKELSQQTSILSDPSQVPRQLTQYAQQSTQDRDFRTSRTSPLDSQDSLDVLYNS